MFDLDTSLLVHVRVVAFTHNAHTHALNNLRAHTLDALRSVDVHLDAHMHILDARSMYPCIHLMRTTFMVVQ